MVFCARLMLEDEGVYECSETGLVFEVSQRVRIRYRVLSWSKFGAFLSDSWKFAGPIFDVDCDPSILKSIQFPHSLCLAGTVALFTVNRGPLFIPHVRIQI